MVFRKSWKVWSIRYEKSFEIFRQPSIRTDILPKCSVGCPCSVLYTSLVSFEVLLFSNANGIVSSNHRSINMSMASLLHEMRIVALFFEFFEAICLHAKRTRFWRPKVHFRPQSLRFRVRVVSTKTLGTRLPLVSALGPLFRRPGTTSWGGLGPPKFFVTRDEKFAFTRQK